MAHFRRLAQRTKVVRYLRCTDVPVMLSARPPWPFLTQSSHSQGAALQVSSGKFRAVAESALILAGSLSSKDYQPLVTGAA